MLAYSKINYVILINYRSCKEISTCSSMHYCKKYGDWKSDRSAFRVYHFPKRQVKEGPTVRLGGEIAEIPQSTSLVSIFFKSWTHNGRITLRKSICLPRSRRC